MRTRPETVTRWELAAVLAILLVAAVARMGWPGLTEFKADEARLLSLALEMSGGEFAVRGISSSVGFPNFPMSVWLYSLPLFIWRHPIAATLFTGLLGTLAIAGIFWLVRRYWGPRAAVAATLLYAVSPWAILFSRKIWAQNLLPFFVVGWAIAAALTFIDGKRWWIVVHLLCLAITVQIHFAAIGLVPVTLVWLFFYRRTVSWRYVLVGGILSVLTAAPFLWHLWRLWQTEGGIPLSTGQSSAAVSLESLYYTLLITIGEGVQGIAGAAFGEQLTWRPLLIVVYLVWAALTIGGVLWLVFRRARGDTRPAIRLGIMWTTWLLGPGLFFLWHITPVYIHYFIAVLPAPFLLAGIAFDQLVSRAGLPWRGLLWAALLFTAVAQLLNVTATLRFAAANPLTGGFGVPLKTKLVAADTARHLLAEANASEVLLAGDGSYPTIHDFPAEFDALLFDVPRRFVDLNREAVFPAAASVVLLGLPLDDSPTSVRDVYLAANDGTSLIPVAASDQNYTVISMPSDTAPDPDVALPSPALLANFVRIFGHGVLRVGADGGLWDIYWFPADNPDPTDYHLFNHLLDASGGRVAQDDAAAFRGGQWRPGDTVVSRFWLAPNSLPSADWRVRAGMYVYPSLAPVPLLDEAANPASDYVELRPLGNDTR